MYACVSGQTITIQNIAQPPDSKAATAQQSPKSYKYLELLDRNRWLAADFDKLWKTDDGGLTWKQSYSPELKDKVIQYIDGISFINAETGFLISKGNLYRTEDSGTTWNDVGPVKAGEDEYFFENCFFVDSLNGWAVGAMQQQHFVRDHKAPYVGAVLATQDGGMTWHRQRLDLPNRYFGEGQRWLLRDVFFLDQQTGWAVGDFVILWTENGGRTWNTAKQGREYLCKRVRFLDGKFGWATMRDANDILVSNDGGRHWKMLAGPAKFMGTPVEAVFITPEHGFATTSNSNLYETRDGGRSWKPRHTGVCGNKAVYAYIDQAHDGTLIALCRENGSQKNAISADNGITWHSDDQESRK
jgi:photosystem II stability/assembly factor-like uncharacterized protein